MSRRNGIQLPNFDVPQAQANVQIAQPLNDVQLLAMVAGAIHAQSGDRAKKCVEDACDIIVEAFVAAPGLAQRLMQRRQQQQSTLDAPAG